MRSYWSSRELERGHMFHFLRGNERTAHCRPSPSPPPPPILPGYTASGYPISLEFTDKWLGKDLFGASPCEGEKH